MVAQTLAPAMRLRESSSTTAVLDSNDRMKQIGRRFTSDNRYLSYAHGEGSRSLVPPSLHDRYSNSSLLDDGAQLRTQDITRILRCCDPSRDVSPLNFANETNPCSRPAVTVTIGEECVRRAGKARNLAAQAPAHRNSGGG